MSAPAILAGAGLLGATIGIGSIAAGPQGTATVGNGARQLAVTSGLRRARDPQPGDRWGGCNEARAAGTAPIYAGEPGYRSGMDGDRDGVACEPVPR